MRWLPLVCVVAATATAVAGVAEDPTRVTGRLDGKMARLTARFELPVGPNEWHTGTPLPLPTGALVTSALVTQNGAAHRLDLMNAEAASAKFDALSVDKPDPGPRASAVLIEAGTGALEVSTASARGGRLVIDVDLVMPTCFHRDVRYVMVPASWYEAAGRDLRARASADTLVTACGATSEDAGMWIGFASPELPRRKSGDRFGVSADRVDLADESVVRFELDVATMLADVPRDLATVLIVDGSRSISDAEREAQRALVESYLEKAPSSRVQVISFARTAKPLLPAWTTAARARGQLDRALRAMVPRNGSNFDTALAEAATWLGRIEGTRRIVLVTDELMSSRLAHASASSLQGMLPAGTLLHVVVVSRGTGVSRDDELKLASLATSTEGLAVRLGSDHDIDATMLLRPISIDRLKIVAPGWGSLPRDEGMQECVDEMNVQEGEACTWWGQRERAGAEEITLEGWIWGKRLVRTMTPDRSRALDVTRELSVRGGVSNDLQSLAVPQARAVNSTWSLYGAWGGTSGYERPDGGGTGWGAICGCGRYGTIGHGSGTGSGFGFKSSLDLDEQLGPAIEACRIDTARVTVAVELTGIEIADVHVTVSGPPAAEQRRIAECVREVVWASTPTIDTPRDHKLVSFVVGR